MVEFKEECPYCKIDLCIKGFRWNTITNCPSCKNRIEVEFDQQELGDEWYNSWNVIKNDYISEYDDYQESELWKN